MENKITYPIKAVSKITGLSIHVIRAWEKRYNAVVPHRTNTNRRVYSVDNVEKLTLLSMASQKGYSIGSIANLNCDELRKIIGEITPKKVIKDSSDFDVKEIVEEYEYIEDCVNAIKNLNPVQLEKSLYKALVNLPNFKFIESVVYPLLVKIGKMWQEGEIRIVQEHISTAVIRKFLTSLIDNNSVSENAPKIVIATPKGQFHELGALIIGVIASSDGWNVIYMGPDLPGEEIAAAIHKLHPKVVALSIVYPNDDFVLDREMRKLKKLLNNGSRIIVGGASANAYADILSDMNAEIINNIQEFRKELEITR
ncbi:MAG: MerR family transcriptional regulator [Ignavibacteriae bacterium]|nr:MerR family transcriptional regulator [Ignavibacteriota bacterium]MCB9209569.1 MerR family transcriptional regulator [Ignavibacteriales bacterium]MCB9258213.1 MerR family transcriptional regulator [Ignavibacteriales bacterium]